MKPKSKTATPPEKKDRRGWPKGKPRKPKAFVFDGTKQEFTEVPNPLWKTPPSTASEAIAARTLNVSDLPHCVQGAQPSPANSKRLGAEWQFMDLDEWRRNPTCVEYLQKLRDDPMFRRFLGMLHSYASRNGAEAPQTETSASIALGKIQGRREILEVIDAAAVADEPILNPADFPTFAPGEPLGII